MSEQRFEGKVDVLSESGELLASGTCTMTIVGPSGPRLGEWRGTLYAPQPPLDTRALGNARIRLENGSEASIVFRQIPIGSELQRVDFIGNGDPPVLPS